MSIEAELPDGTVLEFPDGTAPAIIQARVRQHLGVKSAASPAAAAPSAPSAPAPERVPSYYDTDLGPARPRKAKDGTIWVDGDTFSAPVTSLKYARPVYAEHPQSELKPSGQEVRPERRSLEKRVTETFADAAQHTPMAQLLRYGIIQATGGPQGVEDFGVDPRTGQHVVYKGLGQEMAQAERERREEYALRTHADPALGSDEIRLFEPDGAIARELRSSPIGAAFANARVSGAPRQALSGLYTLGADLAGGAADPAVLATSGVGEGLPLLQRVFANAGVNAAMDAPGQVLDMGSGVQDEYHPEETALAALIGGLLPAGGEVLRRLGAPRTGPTAAPEDVAVDAPARGPLTEDPAAALPTEELPPAFAEAPPETQAAPADVPVREELAPQPPVQPEIVPIGKVVVDTPVGPAKAVPAQEAVAEAATQAEAPVAKIAPEAPKVENATGETGASEVPVEPASPARPAAAAEAVEGGVTAPTLKSEPAADVDVLRKGAQGVPPEEPRASTVGSQDTSLDIPTMPLRGADAPADAAPPAAPKGGGTKLYSNPADPEAIKELLIDPAVKVVKKEVDAFKSDLGAVKADLKGFAANTSPKAALDSAARAVRKVWWSNTAAIRSVAAKHPNVPEVRELADKIGTDPGRGRVVGQTYERAVQMRSMGMANRLRNLLGEKVKPELEAKVADALAGRVKPVAGSSLEETARRVRKLLDEQHEYMTAAGLEVGYVKGRYYPRVLDEAAVMKDPAGFKAKAAEVYGKMGLGPDEAAAAADDWYSRVLGVRNGAYASGLPSSNFTKGRVLPAEADTILADFYDKDPRANLTAYFRQTSRAAEFARSFGKNGEKVDELFNGMLKKGVDPKEVDSLRHHFESAAGLLYSTRPDAGASALSWIQTAGVLRLLPRAVVSSAAEGLATGVRAHDVGAGFKAMADSYGIVFGLDDAADVRQTAEMLGIVGDAMNDLVISAQFGGEVSGLAQQKLLTRFFKTTQLHQITEAQRLAATRVGQGMIRTLLQDIQGGKRAASAQRLLNELGMDETGAKKVTAWLASNDGKPRVADLLGEGEEARLYRTALQRFVDESIQNPTAADRPQWANHPFGRLAYGITSFMFSFTRNVLVRTARETGEGLFGKGYTPEDRVRLLAPAIALGVLTAAQGETSELRDMLLNPKIRAERSKMQALVTNLSRAGAFGNADPFINIAMSARYNRDLTSTLTGPYLTAYLDSIAKMTVGLIPKEWGGPNTPNTNNAEWQAAKAGYEMVVSPLLAAGASYLPGGPVLRAGYGAGLVAATSPGASRGFADKVVGPRSVKPHAASVGNSDNELDETQEKSYDAPEENGEK